MGYKTSGKQESSRDIRNPLGALKGGWHENNKDHKTPMKTNTEHTDQRPEKVYVCLKPKQFRLKKKINLKECSNCTSLTLILPARS